MAGLPEEQVVYRGTKKTIAYAMDERGRMPAREFLESNDAKKGPTQREAAGLYQAFRLMGDHGRIRNNTQFKKEAGDIFGFKKYQARVAAFAVGNVWYLTHGFKKKTDNWPKSELKRAERIRAEHLAREE